MRAAGVRRGRLDICGGRDVVSQVDRQRQGLWGLLGAPFRAPDREAGVDHLPVGLDREHRSSQRPHPVAGPHRTNAQTGVDGVLLDPLADRVEPSTERGDSARVPGDLPVGTAEHVGNLQDECTRDEPNSRAGGEAHGGEEGDGEGAQRHLVGAYAGTNSPSRDDPG
jgi:hypothetical protein